MLFCVNLNDAKLCCDDTKAIIVIVLIVDNHSSGIGLLISHVTAVLKFQ